MNDSTAKNTSEKQTKRHQTKFGHDKEMRKYADLWTANSYGNKQKIPINVSWKCLSHSHEMGSLMELKEPDLLDE